MSQATLHTDGGSRGNPGPAGIGGVLRVDSQKTVEFSRYIGVATNNQAEYRALLFGLNLAREHKLTHLSCYLDSELVVKQILGEYKVKHQNLKALFWQVKQLNQAFEQINFQHVVRAKNKAADKLVNKAIDTRQY